MKLSIVAVACVTQLPLHARPANDVAEDWSMKWDDDCTKDTPRETLGRECAYPGTRNAKQVLCPGCSWTFQDTHPICEIQCCACMHGGDRSCPPPVNGTCGCMHAGMKFTEALFPPGNPRVCCGVDVHHGPKFTPDGMCGCADVGASPQVGGLESDCCSGKWDEFHTCQLAHPKDQHPGMRPQDCITGKLVPGANPPTCAEGAPGAPVFDPSHCMSGEMDRMGNCLCVHSGTQHANPQACCSGKHNNGTDVCACMPANWNLHSGALPTDCCSEMENGGICSCQRPGGPIKPGRGETGCCAGYAVEDSTSNHSHCGCSKPGSRLAPETPTSACCGGFMDPDPRKAGQCGCIPNGFLVAGFVQRESCCSGNMTQGTHGMHCAGEPPKFEPSGFHQPVETPELHRLELKPRPLMYR